MSILSIARNFDGEPNIVTMVTSNTAAEITTSGYFTSDTSVAVIDAINNGAFEHAITDMWLIYTSDAVAFYSYDSATGAFVAVSSGTGLSSTLTSGHIFVGNASNVATDVAMSGDATMANTGALTIAANAITTAKILNANVTLAKLAAGIAPAGVVKFMGQVTTVGGAAAEAFTVTGALAASDRAFVQVVDNGTNNVTVLQAVVTNDTLTVTFSADPGNDAVINYQLLRAAS